MQDVRKFSKFLGAVALSLPLATPALAATLDLKLLVISTGNAQEDQGLDLIDDMLDEVGVSYEVLDARRQALTPEFLAEGAHAKFNGVILTDSMLYYTGPGNYLNSAFTLEEWQALHQFERDFKVRESVISGYPASGAYFKVVYDLDYGMDMNTLVAGKSFEGIWQAPAGNTELFEYVNTANPLPVTDYSVAVAPLANSADPVVTPLLRDGTSDRTLVSRLTYADGREVLYSGITNAWYLIHSQVLNYEFLNFATRGLFLGSRKVYLAAHVDDLFLADDLWDPVNNVTDENSTYRNSAQDIENLVVSENALVQAHPTLNKFKLDMVFNGSGAVILPPRQEILTPAKDAWLSRAARLMNYGSLYYGYTGAYLLQPSEMVFRFQVNAPYNRSAKKALLKLKGGKSETTAQVCPITESPWHEGAVSWNRRTLLDVWSGREGAVYDAASCVNYVQKGGVGTADITPIVNAWLSGQLANHGLVIVGGASNWVYTSEVSVAADRPQLIIDYPVSSSDPLTASILDNKTAFRFINHTYTHLYMDTSAGTDYPMAFEEIAKNIEAWDAMNLPAFVNGSSLLVTGNHSGLEDIMGTELDQSDDIPYPQGRNTAFIEAAKALGIRYLGSDSSRRNQDREDYVPGTDNQIVLLPRYPTSLFYNATNPAELEDEYNYIFFERYVDLGQDPCQIPGAICAPRSYDEILAAEADTTLRHMLSYRNWPHYFHISNLKNYGDGRSLQFDWLGSVMNRYDSLLKLPVMNQSFFQTGERSRRRLEARGASIQAVLDSTTGHVTLSADRPVVIEATGLAGGQLYGGQYQNVLTLDAVPVSLAVDQGLAY